MNSVMFSIFASGSAALSSLSFRKNADKLPDGYGSSGYLVIFYFFAFVLSLIFSSDIWKANVNFIILAIGACVGFLSSTMMLFTSRALKYGPAGMTFAFQNASAIFPGLILFMFLGSDFGYSCTPLQFAGMLLVLFGLFWGAKKETNGTTKTSPKWLKYALACFFFQILALTFIQGRCILFNCGDAAGGVLSDFTLTDADDVWFMPGQFGASFIMQAVIFIRENKKFQKSELFFAGLGGAANFFSTSLLLLATKFALPFEKGILFPCFAVGSMILCNVWANKLYNEKFNLTTNFICSLGIFMAVVN